MSQRAAIFFARDFLSLEFPRFAHSLGDRPRVYLVMNAGEAAAVATADPGGEIVSVGASRAARLPVDDIDAIARDRTLRFAAPQEIDQVRRNILAVCETVLARHPAPAFYLDEPVSGYANEMFNRRFAAAGALCLHFQSAWVPGYMFFTSDRGQERPVELNLLADGRAAVEPHIEARASGEGLPHYILPYGNIGRRVRDVMVTLGKAGYRRVLRRRGSYIDRDIEAHLFHARALRHSLAARYSVDPVGAANSAGSGELVIFPLHYEPESLLTYFSPFYRQEEIASRLLDTLPSGSRLVLKEHPSQPGALHLPKWRDLMRAKRVVALQGSYPASRLLARRPVVVSLGSTFALEAALAGCPTGVLGTVHFRNAPGISRLGSPEDWPSLLSEQPAPPGAIADWYGRFLERYCFGGNVMRSKTWFHDSAALGGALNRAAGAE